MRNIYYALYIKGHKSDINWSQTEFSLCKHLFITIHTLLFRKE